MKRADALGLGVPSIGRFRKFSFKFSGFGYVAKIGPLWKKQVSWCQIYDRSNER